MITIESVSVGVSRDARAFMVILVAGLVLGALDLTAAFINSHRMGMGAAKRSSSQVANHTPLCTTHSKEY
jgi:hypothetical protein